MASAIETVSNKYFDNPSTLAIHAGTNDNEHSTLDYCFDNFQTLINLTAQKYPAREIVIFSEPACKDGYHSKHSQLNSRISQTHSYASVNFVNNGNISQEILHDNKHIKRHKNGISVAHIKDCIFNCIAGATATPATSRFPVLNPHSYWPQPLLDPGTSV